MPNKTVSRYLAVIGRTGGVMTSEKKTAAARANGQRGGRPPVLPKAVRLKRIRARIEAGLAISPAQAALHYSDDLGAKKALTWAKHQRQRATAEGAETAWWDSVVAQLERGVK